MRLKSSRFGALHILANLNDVRNVHNAFGKSALFEKRSQFAAIEGRVDRLEEFCANLGVGAVAHRLDEQFAQRFIVEGRLAKNVENLELDNVTIIGNEGETFIID